MQCCEMLNKAAEDKKSFVVDEENYEYDLNNLIRKKRIDDNWKSEDILYVKGMDLCLLTRLFHFHSVIKMTLCYLFFYVKFMNPPPQDL